MGQADQAARLWRSAGRAKERAMILKETFALDNGAMIPKLGLGTWGIDDGAVGQVVREAVSFGYRHFDTAQAYGNERGVGEGLRASGVSRGDFFVTTKLA